jgi:uncharacterized membrane protein YgcG
MAFSNSSELPDSQIEYRDTGGGKRWVALLIYLVLALVVATLVVLAGRWVYHKVSNNSGPTPTAVAPQSTKQGTSTSPASPAPSGSGSGNSSQNKSSGNSSGGSSNPSGSSSSGGSSTPSPQPTSLPNNGPGQVIALFAGTTFVAATLHYLGAMRRAAKGI